MWPECVQAYDIFSIERKARGDVESCPHTDFPRDLNRPEFLGFNGEMHIA